MPLYQSSLPSPAGWGALASGRYYYTYSPNSSTTSATLGNGTLRLVPWFVPNAVTITRIGAEVTSTGEAGSKYRIGIYADDGTGTPGALVLDAGQIAGDSATVQELTVSQTLAPGLYWVGGAVQSAPTTQPTMRTGTATPPLHALPNGTTTPTAGQSTFGFQQTGVSGAFSTFSWTTGTSVAPARIFVKVA